MLTRLIYASESSQALTPTAVQQLVESASRANKRRQLTGVLAFDQRAFLQCLEGSREDVSELFCRIAADPRHQRIVLLESKPVHERQFSKWGMGYAAADAAGRGLFLRFGTSATFDPHTMSADSALGLLNALEGRMA
jgi:hypothetical protein